MYIVSFFAFEFLQDRLLSVVSSMKLSSLFYDAKIKFTVIVSKGCLRDTYYRGVGGLLSLNILKQTPGKLKGL